MKKPNKHLNQWRKRQALRAQSRRRYRRTPSRIEAEHLWIGLSGTLDLISNPRPTREQLAAFDQVDLPPPRRPAHRLFVDLTAVQEIDPCALLYLVAQVDRLSDTKRVRISGNFPTAPAALQLLADAGFYRHMRTDAKSPRRSNQPAVEISRGSVREVMNPFYWRQLHAFLKTQLDGEQADALYQALGECCENIKQHAFASGFGKWYALALRPDAHAPARSVILDLGVGIAATVRRPQWERTWNQFADFFRRAMSLVEEKLDLTDDAVRGVIANLRSDDWMCVYLASLGLRKQSDLKERGTGLVGLRSAILDAEGGGALHILSGTASVSWRKKAPDPIREKLPYLRGTTVCLEFDIQPAKHGPPAL